MAWLAKQKLRQSKVVTKHKRRLLVEPLEGRRLLAASPMLLKDIVPGTGSSDPVDFTEFGGATYFGTRSGQLWRTDGTTAGTVLVKDLSGGSSTAYISDLHVHNGELVVARLDAGSQATTADNSIALWKSDGTVAGTTLLQDFGAGSFSYSEGMYFTSVGGTLFFAVGDQSVGFELWKSVDLGTPELVKDIAGGTFGSSIAELTALGDKLVFTADDNMNGLELWVSDGTEAGTVMLKDINSGAVGSYPSATRYGTGFPVLNGNAYFGVLGVGVDGVPGTADDTSAFWKTDGTASGTVLVKDFGLQGADRYTSPELVRVGNLLFGTASTPSTGRELWKSDGTEAGTVLVKDINPGNGSNYFTQSSISKLTPVGSTLYFSANDGEHGVELWKSDGTAAGTVMIKDIEPMVDLGIAFTSLPREFTELNGEVYFSAFTLAAGQELWKTDGTEAGTVMVSDIEPSVGSYAYGSYPYGLQASNGRLFFSATTSEGNEPWVLGSELARADLTMRAPDGSVYVARSNGASFENSKWGTWAATAWEDTASGDFNGDGLTDIMSRHPNGGVYVGTSNNSQFTTTKWAQWADVNWADGLVGDFNGDGRSDIVARHPNGSVYVGVSTGSGFATTKWGTWAATNWRDVSVGDFNGDGRSDLFARLDSGSFYVALSNGNSFTTQKWFDNSSVDWQDVRVADFTGDGRSDVMLRHPDGRVFVAVSTSSNFAWQQWATWANVAWQDVVTGDFNGDGKSDLSMRHPNGSVYVAASSGSGFSTTKWATWASIGWLDTTAADFNGDGMTDLSMRHPDGRVYVAASNGASFSTTKWTTWAAISWSDVMSGDYATIVAVADGDSSSGSNFGGGLSGEGEATFGPQFGPLVDSGSSVVLGSLSEDSSQVNFGGLVGERKPLSVGSSVSNASTTGAAPNNAADQVNTANEAHSQHVDAAFESWCSAIDPSGWSDLL